MSTRTFCDLCDDPVEGLIPTHDIRRNAIDIWTMKVLPYRHYSRGTKDGEPLDICQECLAKELRAMAEELEAKR